MRVNFHEPVLDAIEKSHRDCPNAAIVLLVADSDVNSAALDSIYDTNFYGTTGWYSL
jgi:hypothetical protein